LIAKKQKWRDLLHSAVIQSGLKGASKFDFKYVPKEGTETGKESNERKVVARSLFSRPVEAFYFSIFLMGVLLFSGTLMGLTYVLWPMGVGSIRSAFSVFSVFKVGG
jgi:hypothetical protein